MLALAIAVTAIGSFVLLSRRVSSPFAPKVTGQSVQSLASDDWKSHPGFVQAGFNSSKTQLIRIDLEPSPELLRLAGTGETWEYRIVDQGERVYLTTINADEKPRTLFVPFAYGRPVDHPRLEVWTETDRLATVPLKPFPAPHVRNLKVTTDPPIRAQLTSTEAVQKRSNNTNGLPSGLITFTSKVPLRKQEYWEISILETPFQSGLKARASLGYPRPVLFGDDVSVIKVAVVRKVSHLKSERCKIDGLRLAQINGQTILKWSDPKVQNHLGVDIRMEPADPPFRQVGNGAGDFLSPVVNLKTNPRPGRFKSNEEYFSANPVAVGAPLPTIGIRSLQIGSAGWFQMGTPARLATKNAFGVEVDITMRWSETIGQFEATIPVEPGGKAIPKE